MEPKRSKEITEAQAKYLKKNPLCAISGTKGNTQAHHIIPYEYLVKIDREWLASDERIFVGLCETEKDKVVPNFHLLAGHLGSFQSFNIHILEDIQFFKQFKTTEEIEDNLTFQAKKAARYKFDYQMTLDDIKNLQTYVDSRWPKL